MVIGKTAYLTQHFPISYNQFYLLPWFWLRIGKLPWRRPRSMMSSIPAKRGWFLGTPNGSARYKRKHIISFAVPSWHPTSSVMMEISLIYSITSVKTYSYSRNMTLLTTTLGAGSTLSPYSTRNRSPMNPTAWKLPALWENNIIGHRNSAAQRPNFSSHHTTTLKFGK